MEGKTINSEKRAGQRHIPLEGSHNIRDVGGYPTSDSRTTRWRTFLRADSLHRLTSAGQQHLIEYGLRTVIDLRSTPELAAAPDVFAASREVNYVHISLMPPRSWPDVESLYRHILDERQEAVKSVFDAMTEEAFAVLIHCTAGRDRTGVISALMLGLAGVSHTTIAEDYSLTDHYGQGMYDQFRRDAAEAGRGPAAIEPYVHSRPEAMLKTLAHLEATYQSVPAYLERIGLTDAQIDRLRRAIVAE